jgi:hypothetical protein
MIKAGASMGMGVGNPNNFCVPCHRNKNPATIRMSAYVWALKDFINIVVPP